MEAFTITPRGNGTHALELRGTFPPYWVGSLCARLAERRIDVVRGFARQVQPGEWQASFVLRALDPSIDLQLVDYRELALAKGAALITVKPGIRAFQLEDRGDCLAVSIRAADEVGLLGRLLGVFLFQMLYASELQIETVGGEARDTFVLRGFAGKAPGPEARARLEARLRGLTREEPAAA